jgi:hypothetical protein
MDVKNRVLILLAAGVAAAVLIPKFVNYAKMSDQRYAEEQVALANAEQDLVARLDDQGVFEQQPITANLSVEDPEKHWYSDSRWVRLDSENILAIRYGDLVMAPQDANAADVRTLIDDNLIDIYAVKLNGGTQIFVRDWDLRFSRFVNENGEYHLDAVCQRPLNKRNDPGHVTMGDVNADGYVDIFVDQRAFPEYHEPYYNSTRVIFVTKGPNFDSFEPVVCLGKSIITGLVALDADQDGDSDLACTVSGEESIRGYENHTIDTTTAPNFDGVFSYRIKEDRDSDGSDLATQWFF